MFQLTRKKVLLLLIAIAISVSGVSTYLIYSKIKSVLVSEIDNRILTLAGTQEKLYKQVTAQNIERIEGVISRTQLRLSLEDYLRSGNSDSLSKIRNILIDARNALADFNDIVIFNQDRAPVVWTSKNINLKDIPASLLESSSKNPTMQISYNNNYILLGGPLYSTSGNMLGTIVIFTSRDVLEYINDETLALGATGETILLDAASPDQVRLLTSLRFQSLYKDGGHYISSNGKPIDVQSTLNEDKVLRSLTDYRNSPVIVAVKKIPELNTIVIVKQDEVEAYKSVYALQRLVLLIITSIFLVMIVIYIYFSNVKDVGAETIEKLVGAVSAGNLELVIEELTSKGDQIDPSLFNSMKELNSQIEQVRDEFRMQLSKKTSELSNSTEDLHKSSSFLEDIIENIPDMLFIKDEKLRFVMFNKAGENILGYPAKDLLGKSDHDFFPKEEAEFFTKKDREVLEGTTVLEIQEEPVHTKNDEIKYLHTKKVPVQIGSEGKRYLLGISEDITEKKIIKEDLQKYANDLVRKNEELAMFNRLAVGREERMIELKMQVNALAVRLGMQEPYDVALIDEDDSLKEQVKTKIS